MNLGDYPNIYNSVVLAVFVVNPNIYASNASIKKKKSGEKSWEKG
jgi:hypothetical protein